MSLRWLGWLLQMTLTAGAIWGIIRCLTDGITVRRKNLDVPHERD